jgi:hypothetical protein
MSLGSFALYAACPCDNSDAFTMALGAAIQAARNAGIVTFASSGNSGSTTQMSSPACLNRCVAVAAVYDQDLGREPDSGTYRTNFGSSFGNCFDATTAGDKITCFTNRSACNELAAPGRLITSAWPGGGLSTFTGTSQASPHCAGLAALLCQRARDLNLILTPDQIVLLMKTTGVATSDPAVTNPNPRRIDALAAINSLEPVVPVMIANFQALALEGAVELTWEVHATDVVKGFTIRRREDGGQVPIVLGNGLLDPAVRTYVDRDVEPDRTYHYELGVVAEGGEVWSPAVTAQVPQARTALHQNRPNPFNPATTVAFSLARRGPVNLGVYDSAGNLVATLKQEVLAAGSHEVSWDGRDASGQPVPSGLYFYRLVTEEGTLSRKAVLLK